MYEYTFSLNTLCKFAIMPSINISYIYKLYVHLEYHSGSIILTSHLELSYLNFIFFGLFIAELIIRSLLNAVHWNT